MALKLKTVDVGGKTYAEVSPEGFPVFVDESGKESGVDVPLAVETLTRRNSEVQGYRTAKEEAEKKLKLFEGIDPDTARKALDTVKNLDDGQLVTANKVEELKAAIRQAAEEKVQAAVKSAETSIKTLSDERDALTAQLHNEKIGNAFSRSKFIAEKMAIPVDIVQRYFGTNFKIEDNKLVGYDNQGNKIFSRAKMGAELADFDEALEMMVDKYQYKEAILRGSGGGTGARGSSGGLAGAKTISRKDFEALPPAERAAKARDHKVLDA